MKLFKITVLAILITTWLTPHTSVYAQLQHKIDMKSGILEFSELMEVYVEGYDGNEVIMKAGNGFKIPERAKGLRPINGMGLIDNTGIGLAVKNEGGVTVVQQVARNSDAKYMVKVPKGVKIRYKNSSIHGDDFYAKNIGSEIEVKTHGGSIRLEGVTGPVSASSVHGDIDVVFSNLNSDLPSSIVTTHGDLDISINKNTKADLTISTQWGEVYSDLDIKIPSPTDLKVYGAKRIIGNINGGGVGLTLSSTHGNVYLRGK